MNAKELRLGNYLQDRKGKLSIVDKLEYLYHEDVFEYSASAGALTHLPTTPIPLTEEWLIKFGFEEGVTGFEITEARQGFVVTPISTRNEFLVIFREDVGMKYNMLRYVDYVHQLQNLYFALTGEELKINNNKKLKR